MSSSARTLTGALALLAAHAAAGQPAMTAGDLEQLCAGSDHVSRNACRIYILGVTQGLTLGFELAHSQSGNRRPCLPAGISAETLEETLQRRLASLSAPAEREREAAGFIAAVLAAAFPCTKPPAQAPR